MNARLPPNSKMILHLCLSYHGTIGKENTSAHKLGATYVTSLAKTGASLFYIYIPGTL